jgi:hypothetical protein
MPMPENSAAVALLGLVDEMNAQLERPPTPAELAEVLDQSVPLDNPSIDVEFFPVKIQAFAGSRKPRSEPEAIFDLSDAVFTKAADLLSNLASELSHDRSPAKLADILHTVSTALLTLRPGAVADVMPRTRISALGDNPARPRGQIGDVIAIPAPDRGYYLSVILVRNRFGTAFGMFRKRYDRVSFPELTDEVLPYPLYSDERQILSGKWSVVGSRKRLAGRFPSDPVIYHPVQLAETADGEMRDVTEDEVAFADFANGYSQVYMSEFLQADLEGLLHR